MLRGLILEVRILFDSHYCCGSCGETRVSGDLNYNYVIQNWEQKTEEFYM